MRLETFRIDLGDGDWADIYKEVLRVTARLHQAEMRKYMTITDKVGEGGKMLLSEMEKLKEMPKPDFYINFADVDDDAINEIYILNQVAEWSLGPVDKETIDKGMTNKQYRTLVQEMDGLYKPLPLASNVHQSKP